MTELDVPDPGLTSPKKFKGDGSSTTSNQSYLSTCYGPQKVQFEDMFEMDEENNRMQVLTLLFETMKGMAFQEVQGLNEYNLRSK
jgi:hypothetical protein